MLKLTQSVIYNIKHQQYLEKSTKGQGLTVVQLLYEKRAHYRNLLNIAGEASPSAYGGPTVPTLRGSIGRTIMDAKLYASNLQFHASNMCHLGASKEILKRFRSYEG